MNGAHGSSLFNAQQRALYEARLAEPGPARGAGRHARSTSRADVAIAWSRNSISLVALMRARLRWRRYLLSINLLVSSDPAVDVLGSNADPARGERSSSAPLQVRPSIALSQPFWRSLGAGLERAS